MKNIFIILLFSFGFLHESKAQQITVHGYLLDSVTHFPINGGIITNVNSRKKVTTDARGYFRLDASPKDFFYVLAKSYKYDTLTYSFLFKDTITIYLVPAANVLEAVTVTSKYTRYQSDSIQRRAAFETGLAPKLSTVGNTNNMGFGVGINLDNFFKKKNRTRNSSVRIFESLEQSAYVDYRFSAQMVASYTGFKGDKLRLFLEKYTPTYAWLRQHPTSEDVLYYVNEKLKEFRGATN